MIWMELKKPEMDELLTSNELDDRHMLSACWMAKPLQVRTWPEVAASWDKTAPSGSCTWWERSREATCARVCKGRRWGDSLQIAALCCLLSYFEVKLLRQASECFILSPSRKTHFCCRENTEE